MGNELELVKIGNKQTLEQMENALVQNDECGKKHQDSINRAVVPFAKRAFELHEMQFARGEQEGGKVEIPTPFGKIKGEGRDIYRIAGIALIGFLIWMSFTDKTERQEMRDELKKLRQSQHIESTDIPKTALIQ